jgi:hypothetical protein
MTEFNPEAIDGDGDGLVQEGTEFERPAEPDTSAQEVIEHLVEVSEPAPKVEPAKAPKGFVYAEDGDNYAVIADRLGLEAEELWKLNNENPVYPGTLIRKK